MLVRGNFGGEEVGDVFIPLVHLAQRGRDYGAAVDVLVISASHVVPRFERAGDGYEAFLRTLPTAKISRSRRIAYVDFRSEVPQVELAEGRRGEERVLPYPSIEYVAPHLDTLAAELLGGLERLAAAVRRRDDFRVTDLIRDTRDFFAARPRSPDELRALALHAIEVSRVDVMTALRAEDAARKSEASTKTEADFWSIIDKLRPHPDRGLKRAVAALARWKERDIEAFDEILAKKLFDLDTQAHACHGGSGPFEGSGDGFLYERCAVVARGRDFYEAVVADPAKMPEDGFEELLSICGEAFEKRTGASFTSSTGISYETGSNLRGWS